MRSSLRTWTIAALALTGAWSARAADKHFEKKLPASAGETLTIATDVGAVKVVGTSENEVSVVADMRGRERDLNSFEITAERTSTGVEVKGRAPRHDSWFGRSFDMDVQFTVRVPHRYNVSMNTSGGDIDVNSVQGSVRGETSGGAIRIGGIDGTVDLTTSGGDVRAERLTGPVHLESSGGEIVIAGASGDVDAGTSGGNVRISDVEGRVRAETSGGDIIIRVRMGNQGVYAETSGGNIEIALQKGVGATIDASTSGGEVICDIPMTVSGRIDESRVHGEINGGGKTIHAHTSGGDVRIRARE